MDERNISLRRATTIAVLLAAGALRAAVAAAAAMSPAAAPASSPALPTVVSPAGGEIAPGVFLVPGKLVPNQQPDGNSVVFRAPEGAVVFDTGRHPEHTEAVLALLAKLGLEPRAIVNSHWHLDHVGGNVIFRARYPHIEVYASGALAEALTGFLADYRRQLAAAVGDDRTGPESKAAYRREMALIDAGPQLAPSMVVRESGPRTIAGLPLELHLESHAVTAGDLWLREPKSGVVAAGDLVTLPAPFLDTACPQRWAAALGELERADWKILVPGHGPPLSRAELGQYRQAFDALLACAASTRPSGECIEGWFRDGGAMVATSDPGNGHQMMGYYVDQVLRGDPAQRAKLCGG